MTTFTWNEAKRLANIAKHGIDFMRAIGAFRDPNGFEYRSDHVLGEQRCVLIGEVDRRVIAVVYTIRGDTIRIISARKARKKELELWRANTS